MSLADRAGAVGPESEGAPRLATVLLAFAAVYLIWGSTYLAIRWAIETMPPLLMAAARFLAAGSLLYGWQLWRGAPRPTATQWKAAGIGGAFLLVGGNGAVVIAEQWVPSGLSALIVASVPLWMVIMDWLFGARVAPSGRSWGGLAVGFVGVLLLAGAPGVGGGGREELIGGLFLLGASMSWAAGSIYTRYTPGLPAPLSLVSMQMLAGGTILLALSGVLGDFARFDVTLVSLRSGLALVYLIVFGALLGYGAYIWLLRVVTPARVATYAYVNPVVAMFLGWALADEPLTARSLSAAAIILAAVVLITTESVGGRATGQVRPVRRGKTS